MLQVPAQRQKTDVPAQAVRQNELIPHLPSFCSVLILNRSDDAHQHWGGQSALPSL